MFNKLGKKPYSDTDRINTFNNNQTPMQISRTKNTGYPSQIDTDTQSTISSITMPPELLTTHNQLPSAPIPSIIVIDLDVPPKTLQLDDTSVASEKRNDFSLKSLPSIT